MPGAKSMALIKGDITAQIALSIAVIPGKRNRSSAHSMLGLGPPSERGPEAGVVPPFLGKTCHAHLQVSAKPNSRVNSADA